MTLLQTGANQEVGNSCYAEKRAMHEQSGFAITKKIATDHAADWTPERIAGNQQRMATQATAIWRIAQLSRATSQRIKKLELVWIHKNAVPIPTLLTLFR